MVNRYDHIIMKAQVTDDGWIKDAPVITRSGIFTYRDVNGKEIKEYRSPDEVFKEDSLASLHAIPITLGHHGIVNKDNIPTVIGTVVSTGRKDNDNVIADIIIHDSKKLGSLRELSLGYRANVRIEKGTTPSGERYDAVQTDIFYNHLAAVTKGRAGNAKIRLDGEDKVSFELENDDMTDKMVTVRLDDIEYACAQEVARALIKLQTEASERTRNYDTLQAQKDSLAGQVAEAQMILEQVATVVQDETKEYKELPTKVKAILEGIENRIKERMGLEIVANKHEIKFDEKMTAIDLKKAVITKLKGDSFRFDGKSDEYVNSAYDLVVETSDTKTNKVGEQRKQASGTGTKTPPMGAAAARAKMVTNIRAGRSF